jgi:molybdopterin molybdotransferase
MAFFCFRARIFAMISLAEARERIAKNISPLRAAAAPLAEAFGRVLRQDARAREDFPAFDRSAMDGYVVRADDNSEKYRIIGEIQPGIAPKFKLKCGECACIFTGAQIPGGAVRVLMQEDVRLEAQSDKSRHPDAGAPCCVVPLRRSQNSNIRHRGEDASKGDLLLKAGMRLGAGEQSLLASLGMTRPKVSPPVRVAHFATGNELVAPEKKPKRGQIRDSNSVLVAAFVRQFGGALVRQERVPDDFDLLLETVCRSGASAERRKQKNLEDGGFLPQAVAGGFDLLLLSGGASVGEYDFGKKLLTVLGFKSHFTSINLRPGKPLVFATRGRTAAFILPGNPVSHFVTLHVAVRLALEKFAGGDGAWPMVKMRLVENFQSKPGGRETFWPARSEINNGKLVVRPLRWQSSGDVTALAGANALLQLPAGAAPSKAGEDVSVLMI